MPYLALVNGEWRSLTDNEVTRRRQFDWGEVIERGEYDPEAPYAAMSRRFWAAMEYRIWEDYDFAVFQFERIVGPGRRRDSRPFMAREGHREAARLAETWHMHELGLDGVMPQSGAVGYLEDATARKGIL